MKKIIYFGFCFLICLSCSREEFLDIKPKGVIIPTKVSDYRLLMDQAAFDFEAISPGFSESYSNTDNMSDDFSWDYPGLANGISGVNLRSYFWEDEFYTGDEEDPDWATLYGQIYVTNIVLEEIMDAQGGTMEEKLQIEAEALLQRAFAYFILVNEYGVHYNPQTANTDPAVPLRLTSELTGIEFPRASVQEIYDLILSDIELAIDNLPLTPALKHRPSQVGAYALLARIHLYMGEFEESREAANMALNIYNTLLDYNTVPDWFFPGIIDLPLFTSHPEILWYKESTFNYRALPMSPELLGLLEENDQRRRFRIRFALFGRQGDGFFNGLVYGTGYRFVGFSTPELYLIRAETNARLNNLEAAIQDLNTLRMYRLDTGTYEPLVIEGLSADEVLDLVKKEKRIEYMAQGHRLFDLKRYNVYDPEKTDITHILPDGTTVTLQANSKNWAVPIASKYIQENPEIGENDRD